MRLTVGVYRFVNKKFVLFFRRVMLCTNILEKGFYTSSKKLLLSALAYL